MALQGLTWPRRWTLLCADGLLGPSQVGRGQKLGENADAVPFSDMTVEDLLRIVRSLPPEESAVQAVSRGLFYLDSRALAALLKELHKIGLSNR